MTAPPASDFTARAQDLRMTEPELDAVERASLEARYGVVIDPTGTGRAPLPAQATTDASPARGSREAPRASAKQAKRKAATARKAQTRETPPEISERAARARAAGHIDPDEVPETPPKG